LPKVVASRYKVEKLLGEGAAGKVYLVKDKLEDDKKFALKLLEASGTRHLELMKHEFSILTKIKHPNIARVFDFGLDEKSGFWFYTTEYIEGEDIIKACKSLGSSDRSRMFAQTFRALQHIHSRGIIHYDVKPSNIIINKEGNAKLIDFGLATTETPASGAMRGTIGYAAPEVVRGELGDPRSDLYSLGVVYYEVLAGKRPFEDDSVLEVLQMQATTEPEPLRKSEKEVPVELEQIVLRLLERRPDLRYYTANEVNRALSLAMNISLEEETTETAMAYLLSGGFVGRDEELKRFQSLIDTLKDDFKESPIWFVTGETGIGKSRFLREIGYYAQLNGVMLIRNRCAPSHGQQSGPFSDAVRNIAAALPKDVLEKYTATVETLRVKTRDTEADSRGRIIHETVLLFIEAAREHPILISIDDAEQADEDTLALLEHLAQLLWLKQQEDKPVALLIMCGCNTEVESAKTAIGLIDRLAERGLAGRIPLSPLSGKASTKLLSAMLGGVELPEDIAQTVLGAAGGNPLIIEHTLQQLFESKHLFYEMGKWRATTALAELQLPRAGGEALRQRIGSLSDNERAIVEALACISRPADFGLLSDAAGIQAAVCAGAIEQLVSCRLLVSDEEGNYAFVSGSMNDVAIREINPERRLVIHRQIFSHLEKENGDAVECALQAEMAELERDKLLPLLWEAAKRIGPSSSISTTIHLYETLRRHQAPHSEEWYKVQRGLAAIYLRTGELQKVFDCVKAADHESLWQYPQFAIDIMSYAVSAHLKTGTVGEAERLVEKLEENFSRRTGVSAHLRAGVSVELGRIVRHKGELQKTRELWVEARRIYASRRDTERVNHLDYLIVTLDFQSGKHTDAGKRTRLMLKRKSAERLYASLHNVLGIVYAKAGKHGKAVDHLRLAARECKKAGRLLDAGIIQANIGSALGDRGEYGKALDAFTEAKRLFQVAGDEISCGITLSNLGDAHFLLGRTREALSSVEQALEVAEKTSSAFVEITATLSRAAIYGVLGKTRAALADADKTLQLARDANTGDLEAAALCQRAILLAFLCGDFDAAENDLAKARELAKPDNPARLGKVLIQLARISKLKGKTDEALSLMQQVQELDVGGSVLWTVDLIEVEMLAGVDKVASVQKIFKKLDGESLNFFDRIQVKILQARYGMKTGDAPKALQDATDALKSARQAEDVVLTFETSLISALCAAATKNNELSLRYLTDAKEAFDRIASELPEEYDRESLRSSPFHRALDETDAYLKGQESKRRKPAPSEENHRLEREMPEISGMDERLLEREGLALLNMIARLSAAELDVQKILNLALGMALDLTQAERGFIILVDEDGKLKHLAARNIRDEEITSPEYQTSHTMVIEVIRTGQSKLVSDIALNESLRNAQSVVDLGLHSVFCVPIISDKRTIGVVYLDSTSLARTFTETDVALIGAFAERIAPIIMHAISEEQLHFRLRSLEKEVRTRYAYSNIIGRSKPMKEVFRILDSVTDNNLTVLVYGETGTGKELVAKALHYNGNRKDAPFVSINCAAITESLLESELFGHVKGAFTGAVSDKAGLIESAGGGTLFLDEVGSMPPAMQAKLLRVIEEREVRKIGAPISTPVDIRLVCSTNIPLEQLVEKGLFREDLFYRINVVRIALPPLRERREDIPILVRHFLKEFANDMKTEEKPIDGDALGMLHARDFPGNVRQLRNILQQAFIASGKRITNTDIENTLSSLELDQVPQEGALARELSLDEYAKEFILLHEHRYSEAELAKKLGIGRKTLWLRRKEWNIPRSK